MWANQIAEIGKHYRVIAPDLRGHGDSSAPEGVYTMDEIADDVIELLDRLQIKQPVVVGGLSMGGGVRGAFAGTSLSPAPVCGLLLITPRRGGYAGGEREYARKRRAVVVQEAAPDR